MFGWIFVATISTAKGEDPSWAAEMGRGGTVLADPNGMEGLLRSPGLVALVPRYELGGGYVFGPDQERRMQAGAVDSLTAPVSLALSYQRTSSTPQAGWDELPGWVEMGEDFSNPKEHSRLGGALGKGWLDGKMSVGIGAYYDNESSRFGGEVGHLDVNLGVATFLAEQLTLAATVNHLVPYEDRPAPLELGAGLHWGMPYGVELAGDFRAALAPEGDTALSGAVGMAIRVADIVPIRTGFEWDGLEGEERVWAGLGLRSEVADLDYAFGVSLAGANGRIWNGLSLRFKI
jgi:hypothetical protein